MKAWPLIGIGFIQGILLLAHWFIYETWITFWGALTPAPTLVLQAALLLLGLSFTTAALLGFYFTNPVVTTLYRIAAVWLGVLNFLFLAALLCWPCCFLLSLLGLSAFRPLLAAALLALALIVSLYGLLNARHIRIHRHTIQLPGLPDAWRGRTALLLSDLHLGNINGIAFSRRVVALAASLKPQIIFLPGDLFDGSLIDPHALTAAFRDLNPPLGIYFSAGNHDEFGHTDLHADAMRLAGIRVLDNEKVVVDGLLIAGVPCGASSFPVRLGATLETLRPLPGQAAVLLNHIPNRLPIIEQAGFSLLLSGHTHGGQIFPFTWLTRRAFGKFTYGLQRFGALQVFTSSGVGSWGPPMRVGSQAEMVLLTFA